MMYSLLRNILFKLEPELSHDVALNALKLGLYPTSKVHSKPIELMGLTFPNKVGLAAGLDKNGDYIDALAKLGFGHIEIGTITPKPQPGNPKPRLFRLTEHNAIINRMGFNNKGVAHLVEQVKKAKYRGILGINIGKNLATPVENAIEDYMACYKAVYEHASYITVNISSPNTPGLRSLQFGKELAQLLTALKQAEKIEAARHKKRVPLVVKIAPDMTTDELSNFVEIILAHKIDGVIATNTTVSREGVAGAQYADEAGGLSGAPLMQSATKCLETLAHYLAGEIPLIGVGGIMSAEDANTKLTAGADLVQIYTGFIYHGPKLIKACASL